MKKSNGRTQSDASPKKVAGQSDDDMPRMEMSHGTAPGDMPRPLMVSTRGMSTGTGMKPFDELGFAAGMGATRQAQGSAGGNKMRVLVEMRVSKGANRESLQAAIGMAAPSFQVDANYRPVPVTPTSDYRTLVESAGEEVIVVRGTVDEDKKALLEAQPNVIRVWQDTKIAPFAPVGLEERVREKRTSVKLTPALGTCPIGTCDCSPGTPKGAIADVASYLGVDQIWADGPRGEGMVIGIVDGGITAVGRTPKPGETAKISRVIDGWPADWGTTAVAWGEHGNMTSTDALGMAPQAQIYDIRISDGDAISDALAGFQWAIDRHAVDGTPHVLSNSWGIFQEAWDPAYARDPNHPFTRKVVDALDAGILVLFAAGNCGGTCPDGRCGADSGPGRDIWGANGHPRVMTVGAVNRNEQFVGYSSQGPAALEANKPDFCSITHFQGFFNSDSGTSAATPIAAGVVALLKQANPALTQDQVKDALKGTAKDIGPTGWDQHSGAGIIQAKAAYDRGAHVPVWSNWESLGGYCMEGPAAASWAANRLDTFVIGSDHAMYHKWWDGASWSDWESLGGYCREGVAAVSWGPDRIDCFVIGSDHAMYHKWWDGSAWSGWENLGGYCRYGVAVSSWAANRLDCFVIGTDHAMYHKWWDGAGWSDWEYLGGYCISGPAAVSWGPNRIDTFVIGSDHATYHKWWDGVAWSDWESLGGYCIGGLGASSWETNRIDVFTIGTDDAMYHRWWDGVAWNGWETLGGYCTGGPGASSWSPNRIDAFVIGSDDAMYHKRWG